MSYEAVQPTFYQFKVPGTPWQTGAPGWSVAPVPGWGQNPNQVGPPRIAVNGPGDDPLKPVVQLATLGVLVLAGVMLWKYGKKEQWFTPNAGVNGYWRIVRRNGKLDPRRFVSSHEAGAAANKKYGLGNWTLEWEEA